MQFLQVLLSFALLTAPIFAIPVGCADETVQCTATDVSNPKHHRAKTWTINVDTAKAEIHKAGISTQGKSGYPHPYRNHDKLDWAVRTCKKANIDLLEYPIFWEGHAPIDNTKKTAQQASSPLRVVYANDRGTPVSCGVMTHTQAKKQESVDRQESWQGLAGFAICT